MEKAQQEAAKVLGAEDEDGDGAPTRPLPMSIVSNDDQYKLESAVKKARKAGNCDEHVRKQGQEH